MMAAAETTDMLSDFDDDDFGAGSIIDDLLDDEPSRSSPVKGLRGRGGETSSSRADSGISKLKPRKSEMPPSLRNVAKPGAKHQSPVKQNYTRLSSNTSVHSARGTGRIQSHPHLGSQQRLGTSASQKSSTHTSKPSIVADRVASARKKKLNELISQNVELSTKNDELTRENRLLKLLQKRHENSLKKYEHATEELPTLINQHNEQRRVDKAQLRRARDQERKLDGQVSAMTQELAKKDSLVSRMKAIVEDKDLRNAEDLKKRLAKVDRELEFLKKDVLQKDRKYELDKASLERQLKAERIKSKQLVQEISVYRNTNLEIQSKLKQKERAMNNMNLRVRDPGGKRRSVEGSRASSRASGVGKVSPMSANTKHMAKVMTNNDNDDRVDKILSNVPRHTVTAATSITNVTPLPTYNNATKPGTAQTSKWGGSTNAPVQLTPRSILVQTPVQKPQHAVNASTSPAMAKTSSTSVNTMSTTISAVSSGRVSKKEQLPPLGQQAEKQTVNSNSPAERSARESPDTLESPRKTPKPTKNKASRDAAKPDDMLSPPLVIRTVSSNETTPIPNEAANTTTSPTLDDLLADTPQITKNLKRTPPLSRTPRNDPANTQNIFQTEVSASLESKSTPKLGSRQSTASLEAILSAPVKPNRGKVKSPDDFEDLISFNDAPKGKRRSNSKKLHRRGSSDSGFSVKKADKKEYNFSSEVNNLYKGLPASGPLTRKTSFEDLFRPQVVKKKPSSTNINYADSAETIFGNGDHRSPALAVQKNLTPKSVPRETSQSKLSNNPGRAVSPYIEDDLEEIFY